MKNKLKNISKNDLVNVFFNNLDNIELQNNLINLYQTEMLKDEIPSLDDAFNYFYENIDCFNNVIYNNIDQDILY